jgi:3'-5' exoribonuclease
MLRASCFGEGMNKSVEQLRKILSPHVGFPPQGLVGELQNICDKVLDDERFSTFPASISKHHCWNGGLADHTLQVVQQGLMIAGSSTGINGSIVAIAATWHDYGKVFDYEFVSPYGVPGMPEVGEWKYTLHRDRIRHLPRSYAEFMIASDGLPDYCNAFRMAVGHCILAHHGALDSGSPVLPATKEAWAVHLADMISVHCIESRK